MASPAYLSLAYINSNKEFAPIGFEEEFCKRIDDEKQNVKNDFFGFYPELWNKIYDIKEAMEKKEYPSPYNEKIYIFNVVDNLIREANFMKKQNLYDSVFPLKNCKYSQYTPVQLRKMYIVKQLCKKYEKDNEEDLIKVIENYDNSWGRYISIGKKNKRDAALAGVDDFQYRRVGDVCVYSECLLQDLYIMVTKYEHVREYEGIPDYL